MILPIFLNFLQDLARLGSIGQGAFLFLNLKNKFIEIIVPAKIKIPSLWSVINPIWGIAEVMPANTAPAPSRTNKVGKAQQNNVPKDEKKDKKEMKWLIFLVIKSMLLIYTILWFL